MQLLANAEQMQGFDREAIQRYAIPGLVLMENAGRAFVDSLEHSFGPVSDRNVLVVCGKGNNGGDGLVVARHCANRGARVTVALLARASEVRGDAKTNLIPLQRLARSGVLQFLEVRTPRALSRVSSPGIIVDAIFGTGFTGAVRGIQKAAIEWINRQNAQIASVDVPSGVDGSTGCVENVAVCARLTVSMGLAKIGHYTGAGRECSGTVVVGDISMPSNVVRPAKQQVFRILTDDVRGAIPHRPLTAHKYNVGKVLVVAGSRNFTGAPSMTAMSALRAGAGAVVLAVPQSIHPILARKLTEVILLPLEETSAGTIAVSALESIRDRIRWADVVAIGPGMSRDAETDRLVRTLVVETEKPLVIDADALNALAEHSAVLRSRKVPAVLTPHSGELSRLTGVAAATIEHDRVAAVREASKILRSIVVLKGSPTVTSEPAGCVYMNSTGNPGMATIGSGDVLTGLIAGLAAEGMDRLAAAWGGVYLHGLAGDIAAGALGEPGLLATDILNALPTAMKSLTVGKSVRSLRD